MIENLKKPFIFKFQISLSHEILLVKNKVDLQSLV